MIAPRKQKLKILGLGHTIGTPLGGIEADVLVVRNFTELEENAKEVNKIINMPHS